MSVMTCFLSHPITLTPSFFSLTFLDILCSFAFWVFQPHPQVPSLSFFPFNKYEVLTLKTQRQNPKAIPAFKKLTLLSCSVPFPGFGAFLLSQRFCFLAFSIGRQERWEQERVDLKIKCENYGNSSGFHPQHHILL